MGTEAVEEAIAEERSVAGADWDRETGLTGEVAVLSEAVFTVGGEKAPSDSD
jgi:hypothetical protein